jgi:hypothetical protein
MRDIMGEKAGEVFTNMMYKKSIFCLLLLPLIASCSGDRVDDPIPVQQFPDIVVNLSLPDNASLQIDGGYKYINDGGVRGIILYRFNSSTFLAYERNCSFQPISACATVEVHSSGLFMEDPCCASMFGLADGFPTGGPAWRPLLQYQTIVDGGQVTITDDVI